MTKCYGAFDIKDGEIVDEVIRYENDKEEHFLMKGVLDKKTDEDGSMWVYVEIEIDDE